MPTYTYSTPFEFTNPLPDDKAFHDARRYLDSWNVPTKDCPSMSYFLRESVPEAERLGLNVAWRLGSPEGGSIEVESPEELDTETLSKISMWISGQNSDGLGEGFEQQDFAIIDDGDDRSWDDDEDYDPYDPWSDDGTECVSFDWQDNDYMLRLWNATDDDFVRTPGTMDEVPKTVKPAPRRQLADAPEVTDDGSGLELDGA